MKESYAKKFKEWEKELTDSAPRELSLTPRAYPYLLLSFLGLGLSFALLAYFVFSPLLRMTFSLVVVVPTVAVLSAVLIGLAISSEWKAVKFWEKTIGKIKDITSSRGSSTYAIEYIYKGQTLVANISYETGLDEVEKGDSAVLLVNPNHPKSCIAYGGLLWKARSEK